MPDSQSSSQGRVQDLGKGPVDPPSRTELWVRPWHNVLYKMLVSAPPPQPGSVPGMTRKCIRFSWESEPDPIPGEGRDALFGSPGSPWKPFQSIHESQSRSRKQTTPTHKPHSLQYIHQQTSGSCGQGSRPSAPLTEESQGPGPGEWIRAPFCIWLCCQTLDFHRAAAKWKWRNDVNRSDGSGARVLTRKRFVHI